MANDKQTESKEILEDLVKKGPQAVSQWAKGKDDIVSPDKFFESLQKPVESRAHEFFKGMREDADKIAKGEIKAEDSKFQIAEGSKILLVDPKTSKWKWATVNNSKEFLEWEKKGEAAPKLLEGLREGRMRNYFKNLKAKTKEDFFGGGDGVDSASFDPPSPQQTSGYEVKHEYTPLLGTPFFKQMYLYDRLLMHSKAFWYKNYSGPAKLAMNIFRNFVIGEGFSVSIDDDKCREAWEAYEKRSNIHDKLPVWHDEAFFDGNLMIEKKFTPAGVIHESVDVSTIWEIVTDPENISDIKYYHQQYPTQWQLFATKTAPITKYIIRQIPPDLIRHIKYNCTSWEKFGRSEMLAALLYLKYFDDYIGFKLQRTKSEAAYFWDVLVKGDSNAVNAYIQQTLSLVDITPGSENVHNEAIERKAVMPSLSHVGSDDVAKWILSYIAMSFGIPASYYGTLESTGGSRASALVSTEPVTKAMEERRLKFENLLHGIFEDVMIDAGLDPDADREFNFPELIVEDRSKKIQDLIMAHDKLVISHQTMSEIMAKELNVTTYDYDDEQKQIEDENLKNPLLLQIVKADSGVQDGGPGGDDQDLTGDGKGAENQGRTLDRDAIRDEDKQQQL